MYKEIELFNNKLSHLRKLGKYSNVSLQDYQSNLMRMALSIISFDSYKKLEDNMSDVLNVSNSVKVKKNQRFISKINKKEKRILDDINRKLNNIKYH